MINSIYKRGYTYWWQYRQHGSHGKKLTQSLGTTDRSVAEQRRRELLIEKKQEEAGILPPKRLRDAAQRPLPEHLSDFVANLETVGRSDKHVANIRHRVDTLLRECQWDLPGQITTGSFEDWRGRQRLSAKTLNDYLQAVGSFLKWMKRHQRVNANPFQDAPIDKIEMRGRKTRVRRAFTTEEIIRLLPVVPPDRRAIYLIALYTGLRHGELKQLRWSDLCLDDEIPFVSARPDTTKNGKPVEMGLHRDVVTALKAIRPSPAVSEEPVFPRMPRIERFRRDLKLAGVLYRDAAGRVSDFHSLRYTFCTNMGNAGVQPAIRQELMRHKDGRMTERLYTDAPLLKTRAAIEMLPSYLDGLSQKLQQNCGTERPGESSTGAGGESAKATEPPVNIEESHALARSDAPCREVELAGATGLEPATSAVTGQRSKPIELRPHTNFTTLNQLDGGR